jgi:outer membrane receptor protein involved in Fe transport
MNVIQMSARDINLTARQATSTLATSQLVTVDGRSVYLDFFGLVLWDLVPSPTSGEIKQIEVVRGPASVVWGANAVNGVVNIITKTPRENEGFGVVLGAGLFNRDGGSREGDGNGYQWNGSFSYAHGINDKWSYRLNAGYFQSDPYSRPTGTIPLDCHPFGVTPCRTSSGAAVAGGVPIGGAAYPTEGTQLGQFQNEGTQQPKFGLRFDQDFTNGGRMTYEGGYYGTEGIVHTGIGPFRLESGSYLAFGRAAYTKGALRISAFANFLDASAPNLLATDPDTLGPVVLDFKTQTYDLEVGNTNVLAGHHIFTYGGNVRQNNFDISLAQGDDRTELGAYLQWEYFVDKFRFALGGRVDKFGNIEDPVFSPRVSVMYKPTPTHSIRASYNRAFVSPSFINNYLNQNISNTDPIIDLTPLKPLIGPAAALVPPPFFLTINAYGNPNLKEQSTDGYELAYTGTFASKTTVGLSFYLTDTDDNINFVTLIPVGTPGFPLPSFLQRDQPGARRHGADAHDAVAAGHALADPDGDPRADPAAVRRSDPAAGKGRDVPEPGSDPQPRNRGVDRPSVQLGMVGQRQLLLAGHSGSPGCRLRPDSVSGQGGRPSVGASLQRRYRLQRQEGLRQRQRQLRGQGALGGRAGRDLCRLHDAYTMLNATLGVKLASEKVTVSLKGINLTNETIQQHVFGDILKRSVLLELRYFGK